MAPSRSDFKKKVGAVSQKLASFHLILSLATNSGHRFYMQTLFSYVITGESKLDKGRRARSAAITPGQVTYGTTTCKKNESCEASLGRINRIQEGETFTTSRICPPRRYAKTNHIYSLQKTPITPMVYLNVLGWQRTILLRPSSIACHCNVSRELND